MTGHPTLTIDLDVVAENTRLLAARLLGDGFTLAGVTKCVDGDPRVGQAMLEAGCAGLADSRLPALMRLAAHALGPLTLIRAPRRDEIADVARIADRVFLSDADAARELGRHAPGEPIDLLLTVDLGDRREGVLPYAAPAAARRLADLPGTRLAGISVNFACLSGQLPTRELFRQAEDVLEGIAEVCSGEPLLSLGGTCVMRHLSGYTPRFATEIRSGGGPMYGYDFVGGTGLAGLERTDPLLTATVLECHRKPPAPEGPGGRDAFGHVPEADLPRDDAWYSLLDLGRRDMEPQGLRPLLPGAYLAGATSDVSVLIAPGPLRPGDEVTFAVDYDALVRAVTSPFVAKRFVSGKDLIPRTEHAVPKGDS